MHRRPRRHLGSVDAGSTLPELIVSLAAGSIVLLAAAAIFLPAMQNAARDRQAGTNLVVLNASSQEIQRQVRDATYVKTTAKSSGTTPQTMTLCTYPRATSTTRSVVTWKYAKSSGVTATIGSTTTPFGDKYTFGNGWFSETAKTFAKGDILDMRFVTGDFADGQIAGTVGTTLQFSARIRPVQISSISNCG